MTNNTVYAESNNMQGKTTLLGQIFERYAEDTITEERVRRLLEPILKMIYEGKFDKPGKLRFDWLINPLGSMVTVAVLILVVAFIQT